jgi:hypothetical protein
MVTTVITHLYGIIHALVLTTLLAGLVTAAYYYWTYLRHMR